MQIGGYAREALMDGAREAMQQNEETLLAGWLAGRLSTHASLGAGTDIGTVCWTAWKLGGFVSNVEGVPDGVGLPKN